MKPKKMLWSLCAFALMNLMKLCACSKDKDKTVAEYNVYKA